MYSIVRLLKRKIANLITRDYIGNLIAKVYRNKIPGSHGIFVDTSNKKINGRVKASIFWGVYESAEMRFINKHLPQNCDVIELGGSIGVISALILKKINKDQQMIVVEADTQLLPSIIDNINLNNNKVNFKILNGVISYENNDEDGNATFFDSEYNTSGSKYSPKDLDIGLKVISLPALTLRSIVKQNNLGEFVLVSDIEGAESELLKYDKDVLSKCGLIFIELHNINVNEEQINITFMVEQIKSLGYEVLDSDGSAVYVFKKKPLE